jgi:spermidine synthase
LEHHPISYYGPNSGVGLAFSALLSPSARKIGVIGLGTGTLASYGREGDTMRFYEINPEIVRFANDPFTYLTGSPAATEIILGDARLSLEGEPDNEFDLLVLDAFSGDAIPIHLLTLEAFETYRRHLTTNGVMAVLISAVHLNLGPVVRRLGQEVGLRTVRIDNSIGPSYQYVSNWMLLSSDPQLLENQALSRRSSDPPSDLESIRLWTDDFSSPLRALGYDE